MRFLTIFVIVFMLFLNYAHSDDASPKEEEEGCGCSATNRDNVKSTEKEDSNTDDDVTVEDVSDDHSTNENEQVTNKFEHSETESDDSHSGKEKYKSAANVKTDIKRTNQMVYIKGGTFKMGLEKAIIAADGESPVRKVTLNSFWLDVFETSNAEFDIFVKNTGYVTEAEKFGNSFAFDLFLSEQVKSEVTQVVQAVPWWMLVEKSNWRNPYGHDSNITNTMDHPVVHVSWNDAVEFCKWAGKRLPTEAEFEHACRDGRDNKIFPWGNIEIPKKGHRMNFHQGEFPTTDTGLDGYVGMCPIDNYGAQTKSGLMNIVGNVWEWVSDWWTIKHSSAPVENPSGPSSGVDKVKKGGSCMCSVGYCYRHRCGARSSNTPDSSASNLGFRCASNELPEYLKHDIKVE